MPRRHERDFQDVMKQGVNSTVGDYASLLDWRSHRIKRQCRSTLAAETMVMDATKDAGLFARELMAEAEVMIPSYFPLQAGRLPGEFPPVIAAMDCRSLYDLLVKDGPLSSTQEMKRLVIDIGGLKELAGEFDPEQERLAEVFSLGRYRSTSSRPSDEDEAAWDLTIHFGSRVLSFEGGDLWVDRPDPPISSIPRFSHVKTVCTRGCWGPMSYRSWKRCEPRSYTL